MRIKEYTQINPRAIKKEFWYAIYVDKDYKSPRNFPTPDDAYLVGKIWLEPYPSKESALEGNSGASSAVLGSDIKQDKNLGLLKIQFNLENSPVEEVARMLFKALEFYAPKTGYQAFPTDTSHGMWEGNPHMPEWRPSIKDMIAGYREGKYRSPIIEDGGDRARAATNFASEILGWSWSRRLMVELYGEEYFKETEEDEYDY